MKNQVSQSTVPSWGLKLITRTLLGALLCSLLSQSVLAAARLPDTGSSFKCDTLAEWQELYQRWAWNVLVVPTDSLGNAVVNNTVLMPIPPSPGDGTPGEMEVTIRSGQALMLPLWNVMGTSYTDGTPDDPPIPMSVFSTLKIMFKIDGQPVVSKQNVLTYYSEFDFKPDIRLPADWAPYKALVWQQGIGILQSPLPAGKHLITLDVENTEPVVDAKGFSWTYEYHNTWNLQVVDE